VTIHLSEFATGFDHAEGICWEPNAGCFYAGGEAGQVYAVQLDGTMAKVADTGGFILGVAADGAGRLYVCDIGRQALIRVDPRTGAVAPVSEGMPGRHMRAPNWPVFGADGTTFVTDSGTWRAADGHVWRIRPDGTTEAWTEATPHFPNGCALAPDGAALYVVESNLPGVSVVPITADGAAGSARVFVELPGSVPDGVVFTADGRLLVSCYTPDRIYIVNQAGRAEILVEDDMSVELSSPTNLAFGGPDLDLLISANLGRWHLTKVDAGLRGAPLRRPVVGW
jgi:gluconolactonase